MRIIKKTSAVVLTLLIVLSTLSFLSSAVLNDGLKRTAGYYFEFVNMGGHKTTKVYPGQKITARLYLETDFVGAANSFYVLYDKSFLQIDDCEDRRIGTSAVKSYNATKRNGTYDADESGTGIVSADCLDLGLIPEDTFDTYGSIYINGFDGRCSRFSADQWTYSIDFTVRTDIKDTDIGHIFIPLTSAATPLHPNKKTRIARIDAGIEGNDYEDGSEPVIWPSGAYFEIQPLSIEDTLAVGAIQGDEDALEKSKFVFDGVSYSAPYLTIGSETSPEEAVTKLIPADGSTAMVERDGIVETYNTGLTQVPDSVTEVIEPFDDDYGDYYEPNYMWLIYGLKAGITVRELNEYITVSNGGSFSVYRGETELSAGSKVGTGDMIMVYDADGYEIEWLYAVIYGDVDGKSNVNGTDRSVVSSEIKAPSWSSEQSDRYDPRKLRAADLDQNGSINDDDRSNFTSVIEGSKTVNQITGCAE